MINNRLSYNIFYPLRKLGQQWILFKTSISSFNATPPLCLWAHSIIPVYTETRHEISRNNSIATMVFWSAIHSEIRFSPHKLMITTPRMLTVSSQLNTQLICNAGPILNASTTIMNSTISWWSWRPAIFQWTLLGQLSTCAQLGKWGLSFYVTNILWRIVSLLLDDGVVNASLYIGRLL